MTSKTERQYAAKRASNDTAPRDQRDTLTSEIREYRRAQEHGAREEMRRLAREFEREYR